MRFIPYKDLRPKGVVWSRVTLWRKEKADPPEFPRRTRLGEMTHAWAEPVLDAYLTALASGHDPVTATKIAERARPKMEVA